jgi:hypothetical protein
VPTKDKAAEIKPPASIDTVLAKCDAAIAVLKKLGDRLESEIVKAEAKYEKE